MMVPVDSTYSLMVLARAGDSALGFLLWVASLSRLWDFWAETYGPQLFLMWLWVRSGYPENWMKPDICEPPLNSHRHIKVHPHSHSVGQNRETLPESKRLPLALPWSPKAPPSPENEGNHETMEKSQKITDFNRYCRFFSNGSRKVQKQKAGF